MTELIKNYELSCEKVKARIDELTELRRGFAERGKYAAAEEGLELRIKLLCKEHGEMMAIIRHLTSYNRRRSNAET